MATTLNEIVYDLWEAVRGNISDDDVLDERLLKYFIHNQRALWLRNEFNKNRTVDDAVIQDLGAVELEIDDRIIDNPYIQDKKILRSINEIPVTIERHNSPTITRVGSLDYKDRPFSFVDYTDAPFAGHGKFNKNEFFAFLLNRRMYVVSNCNNVRWKGLKYINVRGVFENPEEASAFSHIDGTVCYGDESAYPINKWMIPYLKDAILKADLKYFVRPISDNQNDANPDANNITLKSEADAKGKE